MAHLVELVVRMISAIVSAVPGSEAAGATIALAAAVGALTLGAASFAALVRAARVVVALGDGPASHSRRPRESADLTVLVSQSDPDTDGRPRPRAPGRAIPVV